jgi:glycine/D-amino acid oxidase-like deaminating enzyme
MAGQRKEPPPVPAEYDVIIVGGGFAAIGAALGAKQAAPNARILIIESEACLGGAATHRGVLSVCGIYTCDDAPKKVVGGVWDLLYPLLLEEGGVTLRPTRHRGVFLV